jgi:MFS family permease
MLTFILRFRLIPPHIYLTVVVLSWGIIASLQSLANSFSSLLILRIVLGVSEAAFCGVPFYLSFFYRREELAFRTGLFISAAPLATSFASSLAWLITVVAQTGAIAPWRLLFLVEGFPSVLVAWYCWSHVADGPEDAWFLGKRERVVAVERLKKDGDEEEPLNEKGQKRKNMVKFGEVLQALRDPKCYLTAVSFNII